jgi:hypothetical protein
MSKIQNTNKKLFSRSNLLVAVPLLTLAMVMGAFGGSITNSITSSVSNLSILAQNAVNSGYGCGTYGQFIAATLTTGSSPKYDQACTASLAASSPTISVKAILSGAYDNSTKLMRTSLRASNLIPSTASFPATFAYSGTDSSTSISNDTVDWVMLEVRDSTGANLVLKKAALLKSNGDLYDAATNATNIPLTGVTTGTYKVILRHRNHLAISTIAAVTITSGANTAINFVTNSQNSQILAGTDSLGGSVYGMRSANVNSNSIINVLDAGESANAPDSTLYSVFDVNLDGITSVIDTGLVRNTPDAAENL